jgi:hypothetical protein
MVLCLHPCPFKVTPCGSGNVVTRATTHS